MRLGRVASACAVAISSLGLFTTGASAFKHPSPTGRCRVSIAVIPSPPKQLTAGEPVVIFGRLACRGRASAADQTVRLFDHPRGTPGFTYAQSTTTNAQGFYQFQLASGVVVTSSLWHVRAHGAESANRGVRVAAQVKLSGPAEGTQLLTGPANQVTFTGSVNPADVGARVILQRQNSLTGNEWHRIDRATVAAGGSFSIIHTFIVPGDANIRVLVRSQGRNIPSASNILAYEISQAQNTELTIAASADPISYGQSVTISGTLAGGAGKPVTLLARTVKQRGFAPVGQVNSNASGTYTFPAQSPVNSTFYKVQGDGKSSAVLFEGVKDVLTAQVSAPSIPEGQTLTFSGSIAPNHAGHIIYVERQNPADGEFHVIQVGTVSAESTYSIPVQLYTTGTVVLRVHIPGGPENAGATSQPFSVQVTPVAAAVLMAEAPGGVSQPSAGSEGQYAGTEGEGQEGGTAAEGPAGTEGSGPGAGHHKGGRRH